jgi:hypothetical protein
VTDLRCCMRVVEPRKPVLVRRDGRWLDGNLRAWRRDRDGWLGHVLYAESAGIKYLEWVDAERVLPGSRSNLD